MKAIKKISVILMIMFGFILAFGQKYHSIDEVPWGSSPYEMNWNLKFDGVEFCPWEDFLDSMTAKDYSIISKEDRYAILEGTFSDKYPDTKVVVYKKYGKAYLTEVYLKANATWADAKSLYEELRNEIITDGDRVVPFVADENLNIHHVKEGRNYYKKIHKQFKRGNAAYVTTVPLVEGYIEIEITSNIVNPIARWFWKKGKFQIKVLYRNNLSEEAISSM